MELVDRVLRLPGECRLGEEGLGELQGSLHNGALHGQKIRSGKQKQIEPLLSKNLVKNNLLPNWNYPPREVLTL